jgi:hypothetical protein
MLGKCTLPGKQLNKSVKRTNISITIMFPQYPEEQKHYQVLRSLTHHLTPSHPLPLDSYLKETIGSTNLGPLKEPNIDL